MPQYWTYVFFAIGIFGIGCALVFWSIIDQPVEFEEEPVKWIKEMKKVNDEHPKEVSVTGPPPAVKYKHQLTVVGQSENEIEASNKMVSDLTKGKFILVTTEKDDLRQYTTQEIDEFKNNRYFPKG